MPSKEHEAAVQRVIAKYPQARTKGFAAAVRRALAEALDDGN